MRGLEVMSPSSPATGGDDLPEFANEPEVNNDARDDADQGWKFMICSHCQELG